MNLQGALSDLMKVFLTFYIGCAIIDSVDVPIKLISQARASALNCANSKGWGCPSVFNRGGDFMTYDPANYKTK